MGNHLAELHHVGIFVVQIEQIDLVRDFAAVEDTFLDNPYMESLGIGFRDTGANAARGRLAADDQAIDPGAHEMSDQRGSEKALARSLRKR